MRVNDQFHTLAALLLGIRPLILNEHEGQWTLVSLDTLENSCLAHSLVVTPTSISQFPDVTPNMILNGYGTSWD